MRPLDRSLKESSLISMQQPRFQKKSPQHPKISSDEVRTAVEINPPSHQKEAFLAHLNEPKWRIACQYDVWPKFRPACSLQRSSSPIIVCLHKSCKSLL